MSDEYEIADGKSAKFNAGVLMTQRLNKVIDLINYCRLTPEAYHNDYSNYCINLWFNGLKTLYDECDGWVDEEERAVCHRWRKALEEAFKKFPIIEQKRREGKLTPIPNDENFTKLKLALEIFEREVRRLGIKYEILAASIDHDLDGL